MTTSDRRDFLRLMGATAATAALPESIGRALAIPANNLTGTIADVEHIVVLMQENRSFDHYFGALRGVRGFSDPHPVTLPSGKSVWHQPNGASEVLPYHPTAPNLGLQFLADLPHDWTSGHAAWNQGNYDQWAPNKSALTMAYLKRDDIPFHYALADAFTICDAYHCSIMGPTDPNRYYMWTGYVGNDGAGGGPVIDNAEKGYGWSTYPEQLQAAGISWKIYQDVGLGLTAAGYWGWTSNPYIGNYGDTSLLYFFQYQNAAAGTPLADRAKTGTNISAKGTLFDVFKSDIANGALPQVSWISAPEAYTEHPNWPPNYGAWYVSEVLNALTANPDVWSKTVLFICYDENDGFFDHMVPPTVPISSDLGKSTVDTTGELFTGSADYPVANYPAGPYGLGVRVPMLVISPWSKGGFVNSQLFDHTSIIRFIEQRFGPNNAALREQNISPWRRAVCGDLTTAFNFATPNQAVPALPSTTAYVPPDNQRHPNYIPLPPATQSLPSQEPGLRRARALPYVMNATGHVDHANGAFTINFSNACNVGVCFQVRSGRAGDTPRSYTVGAGASLSDSWALNGDYSYSVHGPNGFLRKFVGSTSSKDDFVVNSSYEASGHEIAVSVANQGPTVGGVTITDVYTGRRLVMGLPPGASFTRRFDLRETFGWYDLTVAINAAGNFTQVLAGHVENGQDSFSDPAIGGATRGPRAS
ncbi:phosphocholine-specific phospholipase C [Methylocapsa acidiphila]|uniref:phosphocholine-specific phospholipase C n=1 Tax=Methylocapsa acidiphila TaxID=133552 RepID=UPI0004039A32|nr:phospholipase C, phosphocholine-specific [Methylocapsa acidiphila]